MSEPISVLYVEDDPDIRTITDMALTDEGFDLVLCELGQEAISQAQNIKVDLILLDVMMPGIDGPTTLRELRKYPHLKDTPVIFMTAKVQPDEVESYMQLGALGVIKKPFDPMLLADNIRDLMNIEVDEPKDSSIENALSELHSQFTNALPERIEEIQKNWEIASTSEDILNSDFYRNIHSLSGSAATFGYIRLGEAAIEIENMIKEVEESLPFNKTLCQDALQQLYKLATLPPDKTFSFSEPDITLNRNKPANQQYLIYVLDDDISLANETVNQIKKFGYNIEGFNTLDDIQKAIQKKIPNALIIDISLSEGRRAGSDFARKISETYGEQISIIFMSGHDTWQDRLNAVRANGEAYISKPVNFEELTELLDRLSGRATSIPYRVLIVDDTALLAEHYSSVLRSAGMETRVLTQPEDILNVLPDFLPDLILMDLYMPDCTGIEVSSVIRQHSAYTNLPIVYLSTEQSIQKQLDALKAGGDDFLQKPISDDHLIASVKIRLRRFVQLNELMTTDGLTGLLNHINLKLTLDRELTTANRRNNSLSFVMIDIDNFKHINDTYGHPVGDRVIKSLARLFKNRLRRSDIAARYGGEEFALILPDTTLEQAKVIIDELRCIFSELKFPHERGDFQASFSAGIASSHDVKDLQKLINTADEALYDAKHRGRDCVIVATDTHIGKQNSSPQ